MNFLWRHVLVVAAVMAGCLLLAACNGGEEAEPELELDLHQYLQRFQEINDATQTSVDALDEQFEGAGEDIGATQGYFDSFNAIAEQTINDLKALEPPAEARNAHDEFVAGLDQMLTLYEDISDRLADVKSLSELQAVFEEPDPAFGTASARITSACLQLQGIADENGIDVDLRCE